VPTNGKVIKEFKVKSQFHRGSLFYLTKAMISGVEPRILAWEAETKAIFGWVDFREDEK